MRLSSSLEHREEALPFIDTITLPSKSRLCKECQQWDDPDYPFKSRLDLSLSREFVSLESLQTRECVVCRIVYALAETKLHYIVSNAPKPSNAKIWIGAVFRIPLGDPVKSCRNRGQADQSLVQASSQRQNPIKCVLYIQVHEDPLNTPVPELKLDWHSCSQPTFGVPLTLSYSRLERRLIGIGVWHQKFIDVPLIKSWVIACEQEHPSASKFEPGRHLQGFKLIDIENLRVVEAPEPARFIALSYTWKDPAHDKGLQLLQGNAARLQQIGSLELSNLSDVIADAIKLCSDLGERYLWVDRLCITQDDPRSKHAQIKAMDQIYGAATFTLVAAVSESSISGLPGARGRPRTSFLFNQSREFHLESGEIGSNFHITVDQSPWNSRGWTFQERVLSPKCLYVTDHQVYFTCENATFQEELGRVPTRALVRPLRASTISDIHKVQSQYGYLDYVCHYTNRKLSYETDILSAFAGIENVLRAQLDTSFYFGLPERYLTTALLWQPAGRGRLRQGVSNIPSWSWAAWSGPVKFGESRMVVDSVDIGPLVKFYLQDENRSLRPLKVREDWFGYADSCEFNRSSKTEFCLPIKTGKAYLPLGTTTETIWSNCPHNPLETLTHSFLDADSVALARKNPGSLVFNTTVSDLLMRKRDHSGGTENIMPLYLCDGSNCKIGSIDLHTEMIGMIQMEKRYPVIVLSAGILPKDKRRNLWWAQRLEDHDPEESPWLLKVMVVERQNGLSRRLGIGSIETRLWHQAKPRWETVVLV